MSEDVDMKRTNIVENKRNFEESYDNARKGVEEGVSNNV